MREGKQNSLYKKISQIWKFLTFDIWRITETELGKSKRLSIGFLKRLILSARGFFEDKLMIKASALTYYTLLAIVPILALIIAIGKGFGFQKTIENFVESLFEGNQELVPFVMKFISNYLEQAHGGLFVGIGIAVLLWSVISAFRQIENNFNDIWHVKKSRSIVRQFTTYFSMMLIVPILIIVSNGLAVTIDQYAEKIETLNIGPMLIAVYNFLLALVPYFIYWVLFLLVYIVIPNTKVRFKDALFAGFITGTFFQIFQYLFINGQINLSRYNAVYGSFAFLPMLLFWLQISWVIILYGAKLSYVSQNIDYYSFEKETKNISRRYKDYATIVILKDIIYRFDNMQEPVSACEISHTYNLPIKLVNDILKLLSDIKLISEIYIEHNTEKTYQPALNTDQISLQMLYERMELFGNEDFEINDKNFTHKMWQTLKELKKRHYQESGQILIKNL